MLKVVKTAAINNTTPHKKIVDQQNGCSCIEGLVSRSFSLLSYGYLDYIGQSQNLTYSVVVQLGNNILQNII